MRKLDFSTALKKTLKYNHFHYLLYRETDSISAEVLDVFVFDEGLRMLQGSFSADPCPALSSGLGSEHHMPPHPTGSCTCPATCLNCVSRDTSREVPATASSSRLHPATASALGSEGPASPCGPGEATPPTPVVPLAYGGWSCPGPAAHSWSVLFLRPSTCYKNLVPTSNIEVTWQLLRNAVPRPLWPPE